MKIAIVSLKTGNKKSGIWVYANDLLNGIDPSAHSLFLISDKDSIGSYHCPDMIEKIVIRNYRNSIIKWIMSSFTLYRIALEHKFDVIHFASEDVPIIYLSMMKKIRLLPPSIKLICTVHDLGEFVIHAKRYGPWKWLIRHITVPLILKAADAIIVPTDNTFRDISNIFGQRYLKKARVIFNPVRVNLNLIEQGVKAFSELNLGKYFLYVAELNHPSKNHIRLLRAFKRLISENKYRDLALILVGPTGHNYSLILRELDRLSLGGSARYLGYVDESLLLNLYKNALAILMVSLYEGFGRPIVEAMHFNLPVIASDRGPLPEVAGESAVYVNPEDEDSISNAMKSLIDSPDLKKKLAENSRAFIAGYSINKIMNKFLDVYSEQ